MDSNDCDYKDYGKNARGYLKRNKHSKVKERGGKVHEKCKKSKR